MNHPLVPSYCAGFYRTDHDPPSSIFLLILYRPST